MNRIFHSVRWRLQIWHALILAIVLAARQVGDAARFAVFAFAAGASLPFTAALGGAVGGGAAIALGWSLGGESLARLPLAVIHGGAGIDISTLRLVPASAL